MATVKLSDVSVKGTCKVVKVTGDKNIKKRLLEMGFIRGTEIHVQKQAPLGDPVELVLKGYHLSLRREEAKDVYVDDLNAVPAKPETMAIRAGSDLAAMR